MTEVTAISGSAAGRPQRSHRATFTCRESINAGWVADKKEYETLTGISDQVWDHHETLGTALQYREPIAIHVEEVTGRYVDKAQEALNDGVKELHGTLDEAQADLNEAKAAIEAAEKLPGQMTTPESGVTYGGAEAVTVVATESQKVEQDFADGKFIHKPVSRWVKRAAAAAPWFEAGGLLAFVVYFLDVPVLEPWRDWLGFSLAITIVAVLTWGQFRTSHEAGERHNQAREARADNNRSEADRAYAIRNWYLVVAGIIAAVITIAMLARAVVAIGEDASITVVVVLGLLALVCGFVLPALAFWAVAFDGSKVARELESLSADLDLDVAEQDTFKDVAQSQLDAAAEALDIVLTREVPTLCNEIQEDMDAVHAKYNFVRAQIGHLQSDPPTPIRRRLAGDDNNGWVGEISTGIPGARSVDLLPVLDLLHRRAELAKEHDRLGARLHAIPPHPWTKGRHS